MGQSMGYLSKPVVLQIENKVETRTHAAISAATRASHLYINEYIKYSEVL